MSHRAVVTVVVLALAASLSGCVLQRSDGPRGMDGGYPMMSMALSEAAYLAEMIPHHQEAVGPPRSWPGRRVPRCGGSGRASSGRRPPRSSR